MSKSILCCKKNESIGTYKQIVGGEEKEEGNGSFIADSKVVKGTCVREF